MIGTRVCWDPYNWESHSIALDPLFVRGSPDWNRSHLDYRLSPDSPAIRQLGFQPIALDQIGLTSDFPFERRQLVSVNGMAKVHAERYQRMRGL